MPYIIARTVSTLVPIWKTSICLRVGHTRLGLESRDMQLQPLPTYDDLFGPTLRALKALGGSGTIQQICEKVCELEGYSEAQQSTLHNQGPRTKICYRLGSSEGGTQN